MRILAGYGKGGEIEGAPVVGIPTAAHLHLYRGEHLWLHDEDQENYEALWVEQLTIILFISTGLSKVY